MVEAMITAQDTNMEEVKKMSIRALADIKEAITQQNRYASEAAVVQRNLGDALLDFATHSKSAKDAFSDFADGFLNDIARILASKAAGSAVEGLFGLMSYAEGGVMPGQFQPVTPMQYGGVYNRPTLGLVAEAGTPEAVVPLKGGGVPVRFEGEKAKTERPTYIINAFSEEFMQQQLTKALSENADMVLNMVHQDLNSQGTTYQLVRSIR